MNINKILAAVLVTFVLVSCSKNTDLSSTPIVNSVDSLTTFITAKDWKMVALTAETDFGVIDIYSTMDECEKDDLYKLNINGTALKKAMVKCDTSEMAETIDTWAFSSDKKRFFLYENGDTTNMEIVKLNANQLILKGEELMDSLVIISTITYSNQ